MEIVEHDGAAPIVIGRLDAGPDRPTLGVYVHDGQPVGSGDWHTPPFEPTLCTADGRVIAFPSIGEPVDDDWRIHARADAWLVCDGPVHHSGAPQIVLGVRGFAGFELTVYGPLAEVHSGHYGNWVPNPALELARLLATCKDDAGNVTIDGFYDNTRPVTAADLGALAALPVVEPALLDRLGLAEAEVPGSRLVDRTPAAGYPAVRVPAGLPIVDRLARAATVAAGREAVILPTLGGSLPLHDLADVLGVPTVILPIANPDNNQHAANENLRLGQLWYGVDLWAVLLTQER